MEVEVSNTVRVGTLQLDQDGFSGLCLGLRNKNNALVNTICSSVKRTCKGLKDNLT